MRHKLRAMLALGSGVLASAGTAQALELIEVQKVSVPRAISIDLGDFGNDGRPDAVLAAGPTNAVAIVFDDGANGLGGPPLYLPMGEDVRDAVVGDFNGDGNDDIAAVNTTPGTFTVRLGNGFEGFGPPATRPAGPFPTNLKAADLDGDGDDDLVISNQAALQSDLSVFFCDGAGGFAPPQVYPTTGTQNPSRAAIGDVNNDGRLDIVAVTTGPGRYQVLLGVPGGFVPGPVRGANGLYVALADLTGDGNLDAITSLRDAGLVQVIQGDGTGVFTPPGATIGVSAGEYPVGLTVADLSGDGELDVITADRGLPGVFVLLGTGAGKGTDIFASSALPFPVAGLVTETATADFDRDGRLDLAVVSADRGVAILRNVSPSYASVVRKDEPVSYWRFGERSGIVAHDRQGRNPGRYRGGFKLGVEGQITGNTAVRFDGRTSGVRMRDADSLDTGDSFTLEAWVKWNGRDTGELFNKGYHLLIADPGHLVLRKAGRGRIARTFSQVPVDGKFHHIVATKDGRTVRLHIDRAQDASRVVNRRITNTNTPLGIGTGGHPFPGVIDEAAIYGRALTEEEVLAHYLAGFGP